MTRKGDTKKRLRNMSYGALAVLHNRIFTFKCDIPNVTSVAVLFFT